MKKILLIGCGEIGSRHLQGLAGLALDLEIYVAEPRLSARELGNQRLNEIQTQNPSFYKTCTWLTSAADLCKIKSDLVIIATDAASRVDLAVLLASSGQHPFFLLEKPVCQSEKDYDLILSAFQRSTSKGWVNTIRRYNPTYQKLSKSVKLGNCVLEVSGKRFGLGSNAIHFLDLFQMLTGSLEPKITGMNLVKNLFPSKRGHSFIEIEGEICGSDKSGNRLRFSSIDSEPEGLRVKVSYADYHQEIDEGNLFTRIIHAGKHRKEIFQNLMVSKSTTFISADILKTGTCFLPSIESSRNIHHELFGCLRKQLNATMGTQYDKVPIT